MKTPSQQSLVAKLCKKYCKAQNINCRAKSASFSMGNSVDITVYDQSPTIMQQLRDEFAKYQYGNYNSMEDIYESSNRRDDIPQTKYLSVINEFSESLIQSAWDFARSHFEGADEYPENFRQVSFTDKILGDPAQEMTYRMLRGGISNASELFWNTTSK